MSDHEEANAGGGPLLKAAEAARVAPSVLNSQPWLWRVASDKLELFADRTRQLRALDPDGRLLLISCGAALHHCRVALAAQGYEVEVQRSPGGAGDRRWRIEREPASASDDGDSRRLVAALKIMQRTPIDPASMRMYQTTVVRQSDRRAVVDRPVSSEALPAVCRAAASEGVNLELLESDQVIDLAAAVSHAEAIEAVDDQAREEIARWVGGRRSDGLGLPDTALLAGAPRTTVPEREFGVHGTLELAEGHGADAVFAILHGQADNPEDWLRAGEGLSAAWLTAIAEGLSVLPFSAPIEVESARRSLRRLLSDLGYPYLVLRLGIADDQAPGPPHTPRLPAARVIQQG